MQKKYHRVGFTAAQKTELWDRCMNVRPATKTLNVDLIWVWTLRSVCTVALKL